MSNLQKRFVMTTFEEEEEEGGKPLQVVCFICEFLIILLLQYEV